MASKRLEVGQLEENMKIKRNIYLYQTDGEKDRDG